MRRDARRGKGHAPHAPKIGRCGKRSYPDWQTAMKLADRTRKDWGGAMQPYRCAACGCWHIGHQNWAGPSKKRPRAEEISE